MNERSFDSDVRKLDDASDSEFRSEAPKSRVPASTTTMPPSARDGQLRSAFTTILEELNHSCSGALGAALVDNDGESVDMASRAVRTEKGVAPRMAAFPLKLTGAHLQIVLRDMLRGATLGGGRQIWVWGEHYGYVAVAMPDGYMFVLVCTPESLASVSQRALRQCEVELCLEAHWPVPSPELLCWRRTSVHVDEAGRPAAVRLGASWLSPLELLGQAAGTASFERSFLVRTARGTELELVREASGFWYAGCDLETLLVDRSQFLV
ncbi:MAG TPA: hypothetical protein VFB62_19030 [Polyangiaceae bacterium]|nr:hypothetical protein [Polyangiaceae bacterium]